MVAILQMTFSYAFSGMKIGVFWLKISLKFILKGPISSKPVLVQIMAWCGIGNKPISEPMMAWFTDAYMHLLASMSQHQIY